MFNEVKIIKKLTADNPVIEINNLCPSVENLTLEFEACMTVASRQVEIKYKIAPRWDKWFCENGNITKELIMKRKIEKYPSKTKIIRKVHICNDVGTEPFLWRITVIVKNDSDSEDKSEDKSWVKIIKPEGRENS